MTSSSNIAGNIQRHIKRNKRERTILFTDIEASAKYWDAKGDVAGRLMVDAHNRLIIPMIRQFRGKVVKTIGDAVMASFRRPVDAVHAAVAIQQRLEQERKRHKKFPKVRIGIHCGPCIVERGDVFGDTVNVASRVESRASGSEILLSTRTMRKIRNARIPFTKKERFIPKGKKQAITVYRCDWRKMSILVREKDLPSLFLTRSQKREIILASLATLASLALIYLIYLRYLISDSETLALTFLNPRSMVLANPLLGLVFLAALLVLIWVLIKMKSIPLLLFRWMYGGMGFFLGFVLLLVLFKFFSVHIGGSNRILYQSRHLFVEVLAPHANLRENPDLNAQVIQTVPRGMLLLLNRVEKTGSVTWSRVLVAPSEYAWTPRVLPPRVGVPELRVTRADKFYFRYEDLYIWAAGLLGFLVGIITFRLRPT